MFYDDLKNLCNAHGTSVSAIALAAGMSKSNVTGWKKGQSPALSTITKLAAQLGVSPKDLVSDNSMDADERTPT